MKVRLFLSETSESPASNNIDAGDILAQQQQRLRQKKLLQQQKRQQKMDEKATNDRLAADDKIAQDLSDIYLDTKDVVVFWPDDHVWNDFLYNKNKKGGKYE